MALSSDYLANILSWPIRFVPQSKNKIPATDRSKDTTFTPELLYRVTFTNASTIDTDGISASHVGADAAGTTDMAIDGDLATGGVATLTPPRNVVITVTHDTSVVAMSGTITGTDQYGKTITEAWSVTATGTSKTYTGKKAFKTITGITEVVAADASANTIIAGDGKVLGLPFRATNLVPLAETEDGATPGGGAGTIVAGAGSSATADWRGTYAPTATLNGALEFSFLISVTDPTDIG